MQGGLKMEEELNKILADSTLDEEAKATKIETFVKDYVGNNYIPREKYNETKSNAEKKYKDLENDFSNYKASKMTDEEKAEALRTEQETRLKQLETENSRLTAEGIFKGAGLVSEDYQELMNYVPNTKEGASEYASKLSELILKQKELAKQDVKKQIITNTPNPKIGSADVNMDVKANYQKLLNEAIKNNDAGAQAYYTRLLQQN